MVSPVYVCVGGRCTRATEQKNLTRCTKHNAQPYRPQHPAFISLAPVTGGQEAQERESLRPKAKSLRAHQMANTKVAHAARPYPHLRTTLATGRSSLTRSCNMLASKTRQQTWRRLATCPVNVYRTVLANSITRFARGVHNSCAGESSGDGHEALCPDECYAYCAT